MELYNTLIDRMMDHFGTAVPKVYPYNESKAWKDNGHSELVMMRDAAFELGHESRNSVNCTVVTSTPGLIERDEIWVYGRDLNQIQSPTSFIRLVFLEIDDPGDDEEQTYNKIKNLEFVRYNVYPEGYMVRVSSESNREQVRISKNAVKKGIRFERVGNAYLKKYKAAPGVRHVRIVFATDIRDVKPWVADAKTVDEITKTMTHILDGLPTDCGSCQMKEVCDEVDGLKEMHMKIRKNGGKK